MAITFMTGFEWQQPSVEGTPVFGSGVAISTLQARTGLASMRFNIPDSTAGYSPGCLAAYTMFAIYVVTRPTSQRVMAGNNTAGNATLRMNADGSIAYYQDTPGTLIGTSPVLALNTWYYLGFRQVTGTSVDLLTIDGVSAINGTVTLSGVGTAIGAITGEASPMEFYVDDIVQDSAGLLATPKKVVTLLPTSVSATGLGWTNDAATTTNLFNAVKNTPPTGIADTVAGTGLHQIRNATANATSNMDFACTSYTAAGVGASDTIDAVQVTCATSAPLVTSAKLGTIGIVSNPAVANIALGPGGTAGSFWGGVAAGTFPTGWKMSYGTLALAPTVTKGTSPVVRVTQTTSSTRIAMVSALGITVAYTPVTGGGAASNPDPLTGAGYYGL